MQDVKKIFKLIDCRRSKDGKYVQATLFDSCTGQTGTIFTKGDSFNNILGKSDVSVYLSAEPSLFKGSVYSKFNIELK